jgi:predicted dehydrogenase
MNGRLRVAVIGTGMIANAAHIPAWKTLHNDAEVVGVADIREEAARETARRYEVPHAYTDPQRMLDELQPDVVSVCTPNVYHREWTIAALRAGAHVLCEKPITTSYANAVEMYAAADALDRLLYTSQSMRFMSVFRAAKDLVSAGLLGAFYYAEISAVRRRGIPRWGFFHMRQHNFGGPICDLGVHMLDALFWITGNPKVRSASGMTYTAFGDRDEGLVTSLAESGAPIGVFTPRPYDYREFDVEDFASGYIRLESGGTISLKTSWAVNMAENFSLAVAGTEGGIQLPPLKLLNNLDRYQVEVAPKVLPDRDVPFPGHYDMIENFVKAMRGEEEMVVRREEVLNVMRAIEGLYRSAEAGREIVLE